MKKPSIYADSPEALAFIEKHRAEFSPESYGEDVNEIVSTSATRRESSRSAPEAQSFLDFIGELPDHSQKLYREYMVAQHGSVSGLAAKYKFTTTKKLLDHVRELRERMKRSARRYRVAITVRTPFMKAEAVPGAAQAVVRLSFGEDSEKVFLVHYDDTITWVDADGNTFHPDALSVLNNLYSIEGSFEDIEVEVVQ